jgi:phage tail-like protein
VPAALGRLYVVAAAGNQAHAFRLSVPDDGLHGSAVEDYFPLRSFGGKALASDGTRAYYDFADRFVPLVEQKRPRFVPEAILLTPVFDGGEPDCVWHRLMLDGCIPPQTVVEVFSRAADDPGRLDAAAWQPEPALQRRPEGSELPFSATATEPRGSWELLFQRARGRHLQLRLRLAGDERTSPQVRALRAYYPRFSYLARYLPKLYSEDDVSASFLDRFLANVEGINTGIEDRIATAQILLDPDATPAEELEWLAGWFELVLAPDWDEAKRRRFVRNANRFLKLRGTTRGVLLALRLAFEPCVDEEAFERPEAEPGGPRVVERFRTRLVPAAALGDPTPATGPRIVSSQRPWRPEDGRDALDERFRLAVQAARGDPMPDRTLVFTAAAPEGDVEPLWRAFALAELGFVPTTGANPAWTAFLHDRYGLDPAPLDDTVLPDELPADGAPLRDWFQFHAVLLPMRRAAHAFTVLLPVPVGETETVDHEARRALATRVVSLQKPAHTVFDVKFFWSAFRVGEARLGVDTVIDLGSRSPALLAPLRLGRGYLGEDVLGGDAAPQITEPPSAGRQPLGR